ncbi:MAG: hypothetical protein QQN63_06295 [Nitrosopumilus sp.]
MVKDKAWEDMVRKDVNEDRLDVLDDFRSTPKEIQEDHDRRIRDLKENRLLTGGEDMVGRGFKKRWWKFDREADAKVPFIPRWAYFRWSGTGQVVSLGATVSLGPSWGAFVLNLPMIELTLGYVPSPMSL